ncbi:hypothetical protein [Pseudomonas amygdali]|uniref:Uncharacterized protein n=1 Tax=Pseudomonas amygdali pv. lachrymans str. M301315 TaxID=629260 RepID=A0AAD0PVT9_PSEAV|nr:hypothetical protein [Pseudomonas amygdali]AXH59681.1 hypothetical protein PLA107_031150 [Pseudomonas amygdali pv. lachrymans str. M301315]
MAKTYGKYDRHSLVELSYDLITEPWDPDGLLKWLRSNRVARSELMESVLCAGRASVEVNSSFQNWRHKTDLAHACVDLYKAMLNHPKYREGAVSYLWANVHQYMSCWLGAFCSRMDAGALCTMLVTDPSIAARNRSRKDFNLLAYPHVPEHLKIQVIHHASRRGKVSKLFGLTAWPECRQAARGVERDSIMTVDLGL